MRVKHVITQCVIDVDEVLELDIEIELIEQMLRNELDEIDENDESHWVVENIIVNEVIIHAPMKLNDLIDVLLVDTMVEMVEVEQVHDEIVELVENDEVEVEVEVVDISHEIDEIDDMRDTQYGMLLDVLILETDEMVEFGENDENDDDLELVYIIIAISLSVIRIDEMVEIDT